MKVCSANKINPKLPRKIINKDNNAIHQTGLNTKIPSEMGTDNARAVSAESCCGERFFCFSIEVSPLGSELQVTSFS
jgi:hypothetical protein